MKELAGDEWNLGDMIGLFTEYFLTWAKTYTTGYYRHPYLDNYVFQPKTGCLLSFSGMYQNLFLDRRNRTSLR